MKRGLCIFVGMMLCMHTAYADDVYDDIRVQQLQAQVNSLRAEYDRKLAELQDCEKNTQGFKIAGIATLAATGVGIYANVKLAQKASGASSGNRQEAVATISREEVEALQDFD